MSFRGICVVTGDGLVDGRLSRGQCGNTKDRTRRRVLRAAERLAYELGDLTTQDLAHLIARKLGDNDELAGECVVRNRLLRPGAYLFKSQRCAALLHDDGCDDFLCRIRNGNPHDGNIVD